MAPLPPSSESSSSKIDARKTALEEAASVLRAVSSGGGVGAAAADDDDDGADDAFGGAPAKDTADSSESNDATTAAASASLAEGDGGGDSSNSGSLGLGPKPALAPRSRSDVLAAAKRRAEERKRATKHGDKKPPAITTTTAAATTTTTSANAIATSTSPSSPTSQSSRQQKTTQHQQTAQQQISFNNQMDWFNLLGVVTNPTSGHYYDGVHFSAGRASSPTNSSHHYSKHARSRHGGLSSHGTPISLDHVGSDGTRGSLGSHGDVMGDNTVAASFLNAAGLSDWAGYANASSASANATFTSVASSLDEFTGWFDHYSRKYLGTVAGIDGHGSLLGEDADLDITSDGGGIAGGIVGGIGVGTGYLRNPLRPGMLAEYDGPGDFGPDDLPSSQLEELPEELALLDLASVERYLQCAGMLGMRFEDRGGGFDAMRERRKREKVVGERSDGTEDDEEEKKNDYSPAESTTAVGDDDAQASTMESVESVPEIFFSPYFDLTDPVCFEDLLVISDEEVAKIREKEAELHALADKKVKEAEEVAKRDAENENVAPRPPPRKPGDAASGPDSEPGGASPNKSSMPGTSLTKDAKTTSTPTDGNVITLRKPETFTSHLDAIELVLLDQVRSKSERFFRETNRFSELQRLVTGSVDEVRELRTELHSIRERCVTNVEVVPVMDDSRRDLRAISRVLESVEDVVNCKASIASLMSVGDHLGAVEAIRLARSLLSGSPDDEMDDDDDDDSEEGDGYCRKSSIQSSSHHSNTQHHNHLHLSLGKLKSLSKVGEQLNEYEKLVVQNLTNELVETFLSWGTDGNMDYRAPPRISLTTDRRAKIRGVVQSLRVCGKLSGAGVAYQRKLCDLISVTVKAIVTECVADAAKNSTGGGGSAADGGAGTSGQQPHPAKGTMAGVASMTLDQFFDCINMLFEQVLGLLWGAFAVNKFCIDEGFILDDNAHQNDSADTQHTPSATAAALAAAADLSEKSVSELLRLRREAHSLVSFDGMRHLWDTSLTFTHQLEKFSGRKAYGLRSTLLAQAKSFVERKHEANMSALVAALDSERWVQCSVSAERQAALTRLCSGRAAFSSRKISTETILSPAPSTGGTSGREKMTDAEVEGLRYKVVWSCLLLLEMVMDDVACAAHFQTLATNVVGKVAELLRLFNTRSTHLVLGAGAIHSAARLKSINAKHLAIVTQCSALVIVILPHIRAALMAQLPAKQHALLYDLDKIKADYHEHSEKILSKLVSIIGGIVEHSLAPRIVNTDFDTRASEVQSSDDPDAAVDCCQFLDNVVTNTKKMHQVLLMMLPAELLRDVFSRIFAYLDHKVLTLFVEYSASSQQKFSMPSTDEGKLQMIKEVEYMSKTLNNLPGVQPWNFTATKILEQELDISRDSSDEQSNAIDEGGPAQSEDKPDVEEDTVADDDNQPEPSSTENILSEDRKSESDSQMTQPGTENDSEPAAEIVNLNDNSSEIPSEGDILNNETGGAVTAEKPSSGTSETAS